MAIRALFTAVSAATLTFALAGCATTAAPTATTPVTTAAPAPAHTPVVWDLTDLYADSAAWQSEHDAVLADMERIAAFRGRLGRNAATLADAMELTSGLSKRAVRLFVYATLRGDEDTRVQENLARRQLGNQLLARLGEATSWMNPELLSIGERRIEGFIRQERRLGVHAVNLRETLRFADHTLTPQTEAVLAAAGLPLGGPQRIYTQMAGSDIPWPTIEIDGEQVRLDSQAYTRHRQNPDRNVRKRVFDAFYATWNQYESTLGEALASNTQGQVMNAQVRNYESAREAAMFANALPVSIYDQLVSQAHDGLPTLHRYFRLRARMLGITDLAYYDIYPDLISYNATYTLADSERITLEAMAPFGDDYTSILRRGFDADWTHLYPQDGKQSGAYVFGAAYDVHPYVLLNHQDDFDSLTTFAHEWGHAVHSVLSNSTQPWETSGYPTFVAEMASTINEVLLLRHLQARASSDNERLFLLNQELELYRGTFFRQTMFGEFEAQIHAAAERGEPLTGERLSEIYLALLRSYHGADSGVMAIDPAYALEWAYIPHFYRNFYVFQYATSVAASTMFAERLMSNEPGARAAVIDMLRSGGSRHPHEMFVAAGVDLSSPAPYRAVVTRMDAIMNEMDAILARRG
jgi:oligoendopeptidase F